MDLKTAEHVRERLDLPEEAASYDLSHLDTRSGRERSRGPSLDPDLVTDIEWTVP